MKHIDNLIPDIYALFQREQVVVDEKALDTFANNMKEILRLRLEDCATKSKEPFKMRMSRLGTPDRKLWYDANVEVSEREVISGPTHIKFIYGDIIEQLILFLAKEAGHLVEDEQKEVEVEGILGHQDCKIDGVTTDIKSTSKFAFNKFAKGTLHQDDPFGYIAQISGYVYAEGTELGAFLAVNKETGELALLKIQPIDMIHPPTRIEQTKAVISAQTPPEKKCYEPEPMGKGGNMKLSKGCGFCAHKDKCWASANGGSGLRRFKYSTGIEELVEVVETPRVEEL